MLFKCNLHELMNSYRQNIITYIYANNNIKSNVLQNGCSNNYFSIDYGIVIIRTNNIMKTMLKNSSTKC